MKVKSLLKVSMCNTEINVMEVIKVVDADEIIIDHDIAVGVGRKDIEKLSERWVKYSHTCFLPKALLDKEVDMVSTNHITGALVIYTK